MIGESKWNVLLKRDLFLQNHSTQEIDWASEFIGVRQDSLALLFFTIELCSMLQRSLESGLH